MKINHVFLYTALFVCVSLSSQETNAPKFGKGLFNLIGKVRVLLEILKEAKLDKF